MLKNNRGNEQDERNQQQKPVIGNRFGRPINEDSFTRKITDEDRLKLVSEGDEDE